LPDTPALSKAVTEASKIRATNYPIGNVLRVVGALLVILGIIIALNELTYVMTGRGFLWP
jgi:hypothetical protein